jgi:hypothetical protein
MDSKFPSCTAQAEILQETEVTESQVFLVIDCAAERQRDGAFERTGGVEIPNPRRADESGVALRLHRSPRCMLWGSYAAA